MNPALKHATAQIAKDGSQKVPQRFLATIETCNDTGRGWDALARAVAGWVSFLRVAEEIEDPLSATLAKLGATHDNPKDFGAAVLDLSNVFGPLGAHEWFRTPIIMYVDQIARHGAGAVLQDT